MIEKIRFYQMYLQDYLLLGTKILDILENEDEVALKLGVPVAKIRVALSKLREGLKVLKANLRTEELAQLDNRRDDAWICFYHLVLSQVRCMDEEVREHAHKLEVLIRMPEMRIHKMGYQKQTASMINFFNRIDSSVELTEALTKIAAEQRYSEIKITQNAFVSKENERVAQEADKPSKDGLESAKDLRKSIEYLGQFLSVMYEESGKEEYNNVAAKINEVVGEINARVLTIVTRRKGAKEEETILEK